MVNIKWKASELPLNTMIEHKNHGQLVRNPGVEKFDGTFTEPSWEQVGYDFPCDYQDKDLDPEDFEILALPPAWYEEFRVVPEQETYSVNRAGQTKHYKYQTAIETGMKFVYVGRLKHISIEEAIRRAFEVG